MKSAVLMISAASMLPLAACGGQDPAAPAAEAPGAPAPQQQVERSDPAATPPPVAAPAPAAIQTQAGTDGVQVALTRAAVTGDVLTVQLLYTKPSEGSAGLRMAVEAVNVIDDTTAQRYGVLRDSTGRWQASPLEGASGNHISFGLSGGDTEVVWFKFPAPPATSPTISINIPNVGPFDG